MQPWMHFGPVHLGLCPLALLCLLLYVLLHLFQSTLALLHPPFEGLPYDWNIGLPMQGRVLYVHCMTESLLRSGIVEEGLRSLVANSPVFSS